MPLVVKPPWAAVKDALAMLDYDATLAAEISRAVQSALAKFRCSDGSREGFLELETIAGLMQATVMEMRARSLLPFALHENYIVAALHESYAAIREAVEEGRLLGFDRTERRH
jgi:hypothetical protein